MKEEKIDTPKDETLPLTVDNSTQSDNAPVDLELKAEEQLKSDLVEDEIQHSLRALSINRKFGHGHGCSCC